MGELSRLLYSDLTPREGSVKSILKEGKVNPDKIRIAYGWPLLHWAAVKGHLSAGEDLLDEGVNIHAKDEDGNTALHLACRENHSKFVGLLLMKGADLSVKNNAGHSPFMYLQENVAGTEKSRGGLH